MPHLPFKEHCLFCDRLLCCNEAILERYPFLDLLLPREGALLLEVVNLEMGNSVKWFLLNIVSGQTTSDALWK